jgi:hypothetical protein
MSNLVFRLSEEHELRFFGNRVLRVLGRIFGPKEEEVIKSEENCNMRSFIICTLHSPNIIKVTKSKRMKGAGHVACMGEMRNAYKINCSQKT